MDESVIKHTNSVPMDSDGASSDQCSEGSDLASVVECPVCLMVPRDLPIPCCTAGHIICQRCRARVLHCPTCRRQLGDNTSSLAAALIERVKHRCKYYEFGCERKDLLSVLVPHEEICSQRTVNCPQPNGCNEPVQMIKFSQHATQNGCSVQMKAERTKFNLSKGWMQWDGLSLRKGEEFDLREDLAWTFFHTSKFSQHFYLSVQYYSLEKLFLFYVMVDSGQEIAEDYRANISISNDDQTVDINFSGPVLAIDRIPKTEKLLLMNPGCWIVHYRAMRNLLSITEVGENRNCCWSVDFSASIDITDCMAVSSS